ncbi:Tetracycline repressor protein class D [Corynebacterium provencense]|uniref:Tetracycline repressor protein class D n=1 Tax=Corynebacterium provencense TaxID=1737425 RepID=A0A2Z3YQ49_9CORY|nr:TetR/AcrR family transcriptional regulator [Corynebacterium provencense]AWT26826.1 Tetracycline repressor protein class D [Corynebacterium provencense]
MAENTTGRRHPGRRPRFTEDDVTATALRLGIGSFSVAAIARELGVTTAAVYRRFPSHQQLLDVCIDEILSEVNPVPGGLCWQDTLRHAADEWWNLCLRHPDLPEVASGYSDPVSRFTTAPFRTHFERLIELGFSPRRSYSVASLLFSALTGAFLVPCDNTPLLSEGLRELVREDSVKTIIAGLEREFMGSGQGDFIAGARRPA